MSLTKEEYIDIIENLDFFYGDNLIATAELRNEKSKELQEKDLESYKQKLNCLKQLIIEHFELKEKYSKILDDVHDYRYEIQSMKVTIRNLCKHFGVNNQEELKNIYLNIHLKFEDLKPNMWVFDNKIKEYRKIDRVNKKYRGVEYFNTYGWFIDFEENRFYRYEVKE